MLGLTRSLRQATAEHESYDFSLSAPNLPFFQAVEAFFPETVICEQHPLDARDRMADRCSLFPFRRLVGRPRAARGGGFGRALAGFSQPTAGPGGQPPFQCPAAAEMGGVLQGRVDLFPAVV